MFRNFYDTELYIRDRLDEVDQEIKRQLMIKAALQNKRTISRRVLSAVADRLIAFGAVLYRRYGEHCARRMALLDQLLDDLHPRTLGQS